MIGNDGLACAQGETARRCKVVSDRRRTNNARLPADTGADQKTSFCWNVFENLAELGLHALGRQARGVVQQLIEARARKSPDPEFGEQLLLADAPFEVWRQRRRFNSIALEFNCWHSVYIVLGPIKLMLIHFDMGTFKGCGIVDNCA